MTGRQHMTQRMIGPNKHLSILHLISLEYDFYTFLYPASVLVDAVSPVLFARYPFFSVTKANEESINIVVGLKSDGNEHGTENGDCDSEKGETVGDGGGVDGWKVDGETRGLKELGEAERWFGPWKGLRVRGPLYMNINGLMNELTKPLRQAEIGIYVLATWNTDYILIPSHRYQEALTVLRNEDWTVVEPKTKDSRPRVDESAVKL
nr:uncharacterized protein CI109_002198 [Kwoniella shandongensis]KAA5529305.1 hypothetical protein CI109_002198 [Kwoniella shandongensis]